MFLGGYRKLPQRSNSRVALRACEAAAGPGCRLKACALRLLERALEKREDDRGPIRRDRGGKGSEHVIRQGEWNEYL